MQQPTIRTIKSFVKRQGRLTKGQQRALDELWPQYGLQLSQGTVDFATVFKRAKPVTLEIGFGMGHSLAELAGKYSDQDFIGIEVHRPGVGALLLAMEQQQIDNLRIYNDDAVEVLKHCIPDNSLAKINLFFPDPWHKKRHHKRRIVQPEFVALLHSKLKNNGLLHMATDWQEYAEYMLEIMQQAQGFKNIAEQDYIPRPEDRPITKFEKRGERLGHGVWDLLFQKL